MLVSSLVLGGIVGVLSGGHLRNLASFRPRLWPLLFLAALARVAAVVAALPWWVGWAGVAAVGVVAAANWRLPGAALIALGSAMNAAVIGANAGMPVDADAATRASAAPLLGDQLHVVANAGTRLAWLGDVLPVAPVHNVYSLGDVVIAFGGFWLACAWLRR